MDSSQKPARAAVLCAPILTLCPTRPADKTVGKSVLREWKKPIMWRRMTRFLIVCSAAVCSIVTTGFARIVTVRFTAEVTEVRLYTERGEPGDDVRFVVESLQVGDAIEGVYAYDTSAPDLSGSGTYQFDTRPCGIAVSTNRFVFKTDPEAVSVTIETANDLKPIVDSLPHDEFVMSSNTNLMKPAMADIQCAGITLTLGALGAP